MKLNIKILFSNQRYLLAFSHHILFVAESNWGCKDNTQVVATLFKLLTADRALYVSRGGQGKYLFRYQGCIVCGLIQEENSALKRCFSRVFNTSKIRTWSQAFIDSNRVNKSHALIWKTIRLHLLNVLLNSISESLGNKWRWKLWKLASLVTMISARMGRHQYKRESRQCSML